MQRPHRVGRRPQAAVGGRTEGVPLSSRCGTARSRRARPRLGRTDPGTLRAVVVRGRTRPVVIAAVALVALVLFGVVVRVVTAGEDERGRPPDSILAPAPDRTSPALDLEWSLAGDQLYAADEAGVDVLAGTPLIPVDRIGVDPARSPVRPTWSPAVDRVALSGLRGGVDVFDLATGGPLAAVAPADTGERQTRVAWSPDGAQIAHDDRDNRIVVRDAATGEEITSFAPDADGVPLPVLALAWPTADLLVVATFNDVAGIDVATGEQVWVRALSTNGVVSVSPDGERMVVGASLDDDHFLLRTDSGRMLGEIETSSPVLDAIDWSPDGTRLLAAGDDDQPRLWDGGEAETPDDLEGWAPYGAGGAWSPDADRIAVADSFDERIVVVSAGGATDSEVLAAPSEEPLIDVAWSPTGDRLVCVARDGTLLEWTVTAGAIPG